MQQIVENVQQRLWTSDLQEEEKVSILEKMHVLVNNVWRN